MRGRARQRRFCAWREPPRLRTTRDRMRRKTLARNMACPPQEGGLREKEGVIGPDAQTERRGDAGPVRGLLGGKASPAAFQKATRTFTRQETAFLVCLRSAVSGQKYSISPNTSSSLVEAWLWLIRVRWTRTAPPAL